MLSSWGLFGEVVELIEIDETDEWDVIKGDIGVVEK
jgi:hypothetical protein